MDEPAVDPEQGQARPAEDTDTLLRWLDLSQAQVSTLLGMSPQAVSKGFKDDGPAFLAGAGRGMRLFQSLSRIGGDRYALAASRLRDVAREQGWGSYELDSTTAVPAQEVYTGTEELWVISDSPSSVLDWEAFRGHLMATPSRERHQVVVFFLRTLEAAERWAEILEREFARRGIRDGHLKVDDAGVSSAYVFLIVTNTLTYSQDFVIADAGSRCIDVLGATRPSTIFHWTGSAYGRASAPNSNFLRLARSLELGASTIKANFFPRGLPLKPDVFDYKHTFMDGLIAIRGKTAEEDNTLSGEQMAGGLLANTTSNRAPTAIAFNKRAKFTPIFMLVYKRRPGEGLNRNRPLRVIQDELDRAREQAPDADPKSPQSNNFW